MSATNESVDTVHRRLCHSLFDALERADVDGVDACYASDMRLWANFTMRELTRQENLEAITAGTTLLRRRTYDDRQVHTFDDGFVAQYTLTLVTHDGRRRSVPACLVATVHDGRIVRLDEYTDSARFGRRR